MLLRAAHVLPGCGERVGGTVEGGGRGTREEGGGRNFNST